MSAGVDRFAPLPTAPEVNASPLKPKRCRITSRPSVNALASPSSSMSKEKQPGKKRRSADRSRLRLLRRPRTHHCRRQDLRYCQGHHYLCHTLQRDRHRTHLRCHQRRLSICDLPVSLVASFGNMYPHYPRRHRHPLSVDSSARFQRKGIKLVVNPISESESRQQADSVPKLRLGEDRLTESPSSSSSRSALLPSPSPSVSVAFRRV